MTYKCQVDIYFVLTRFLWHSSNQSKFTFMGLRHFVKLLELIQKMSVEISPQFIPLRQTEL